VVWTDERDGNSEIYFAELDESGQQVAPELRLTSDAAESSQPSLAYNGSELGLSWTDARDGNTEIYFTVLDRSGKRKASQLANLRVTRDPGRSEFSRLIWTGEDYALTWTDGRDGDFDIYFARLSRAGTKTRADVHVSRGASSDIATWGSGFGLVWHSTRDALGLQIYFARLDQEGNRLAEDQLLCDPEQRGGNPAIAFDGLSFGVAWQGNPGSGGELQWLRLGVDGETFGEAVALTQSGASVGAPSLLQRPEGGFGMAWVDARAADSEVRYLEVDDAGQLLGSELMVTDDDSASSAPSLVRTELGYAVAWIDAASDSTGSVMFRKFCDDGS